MPAFLSANSNTLPSNKATYATIPLSKLQIGVRINSAIFDDRSDRSVLLLSAGTVITRSLLKLIVQRGIRQVRVLQSELAQVTGNGDSFHELPQPNVAQHLALKKASKVDIAQPSRSAKTRWAMSDESFINEVQRHGTTKFTTAQSQLASRAVEKSVDQVDELFQALARGTGVDPTIVGQVAHNVLMQIAEDCDLFVSLGICPRADKYPSRHSTQTAMLAMSIGTTLGLGQADLLELGVGCLIHDVGMLQIDRQTFESDRVLDKIEFLEITKHPALTFEMINDLTDFPTGARMVAYQMHERFNGTGYPRNRSGRQIHFLARIAAVADVFIALISPRPHRESLLPYYAMERIVKGAKAGLFDPAVVRGLLQTLSLFPVGSFVQTNDGRVGKVLRANGPSYMQPIVELWTPDHPHERPSVVDLAQESNIAVVGACAEVNRVEVSDRLFDDWE